MSHAGRCAALASILFAGAVAVAACNPPPGDIRKSDASPPIRMPVGPVPGPPEDPVGPPNPFADDRGALSEGRRLFVNFNCAGCHGDHGGGGMGPSLRDNDWIYGSTDAKIFDSITEGRGHGMPSWQTKLTEDQTWRLVTYIKSFRTRNEPEPPI
jgi:cytochrome c oxidase cbb3-type subunit 3